jgi:hypothetical protein
MGLLTGQTVEEGDFITTSSGAGDEGKVPKLNASGVLDNSFISYSFGNGSDGDVTISSPTTLTRDMYYNNLTVNSTLNPDGFRIFVKGILSGNGTISYNGNNAVTSTAGASSGSGVFKTSAGGATQSSTNSSGASGVSGNCGGNGGNGGGTPTPTRIGVGGVTTKTTLNFASNILDFIYMGLSMNNSGTLERLTTSSGASGGTTATVLSGAGGASGGIILVFANTFSGTFGFSSTGGNGGNGVGTNTGGGGGGGGGIVIVVYKSKTWTGSYTLTGGLAGNGSGTGSAGIAGSTGESIEIKINS